MAKRLLVIEKLVVAIPDDYQGIDHPNSEELTINDAIRFLLQYRESAKAIMENRFGNFEYTSLDFPPETVPEGNGSENFTKETLLKYLLDNPEKVMAGAMYSLVYDEELHGYRNCYKGKEQEEFEKKKEYLSSLKQQAPNKSAKSDESNNENSGNPKKYVNPCDDCDCICDENCPNDSYRNED